MAYTTIDDPTIFFNTLIWTGNGASSRAISGLGFQPDWSWFKERSGAEDHILFDSVRGATKRIYSNANSAETDSGADRRLLSFDSDGFTVGLDLGINGNTETYVGWNWKAGTSFTNDASSTGIGSIDSSGSVSETAGFSICSFTGTGSVATIKHGLSTIPNVIITKSRANAENWGVLHSGINTDYWTDYLILNSSNGSGDSAEYYNDTAPTSSIFTVGTADATNDAANMIAYIFSERKGYSKFGSYTGNGNADGPFVYTGFKPAFVISKNTGATEGWSLFDNKRSTSGANLIDDFLVPSSSEAEVSQNVCDFLSNGFKFRHSDGKYNSSGYVNIYMAFAESPFVNSNGVPNNAK